MSGMGDWKSYLAESEDRHLQELVEFLRIPSVSALPEHDPDIRRAADWVVARLKAAGVPSVEAIETGGKPLVWGRWDVDPAQPTVLVYAHYDVQPPDPLDLWETPPFEPTIRDGRVYARGSGDDKAGLLSTIQAVEAFSKTTGQPPINIVFFFEGEEEIGSPSVAPFIATARERLACDYVISADGMMWDADTPALTVATKGMAGGQIDLRTAAGDLHSGLFGASIRNAAQAIAQLAATFHDADGRVAVEGFYDRVRNPTTEERAEIAAVPFDEHAYFASLGVSQAHGEAGYGVLERNWLRPTLDINGIWGGFQGAGSKTVTPAEGHMKFTCRLVPDQDPSEIIDLIQAHLDRHCPSGATCTLTAKVGKSRPFAISRDNPCLLAAERVITDLTGRKPAVIRLGGTLPIAEVFQEELGAEMVFFAWSLPESNAHAPNEWHRISDFQLGSRGTCALLEELRK